MEKALLAEKAEKEKLAAAVVQQKAAAVVQQKAQPEDQQVGNTYLQQMAESAHGKWPLGAIAELIHNASDANASKISVFRHPKNASEGPLTGLRIDDNGTGMPQDWIT